MSHYEEFDPTNSRQFEEFDVTAEIAEECDASAETLSGLAASDDEVKALLAARAEIENRLLVPVEPLTLDVGDEEQLSRLNIVGVGIGERTVAGVPTGKLAVKVLVKEKVPARMVSADALVPTSVGGVPVDVEETGEIHAQIFTARRRPAPGGVSIGNCGRNSAGTLGCLVTRSNQLFVLSNNHVMALVNTAPLNSEIVQPGRLDGGTCPRDTIARLTQFIPISFAAGANNVVDAAIARTSPQLVDPRMLRAGGALQRLGAGVVAPAVNQQVQKSGRTTQYRRGAVTMINVTVNVSYAPLGGIARFVRQFIVSGTPTRFSDRGDSGSLVTNFPYNQPVGLLFAGNAANNITVCNPITAVLAAFGVRVVV